MFEELERGEGPPGTAIADSPENQQPLDMFVGTVGDDAVTCYMCAVIDQARQNQVPIRVIDRQTGDPKLIEQPRVLHRSDLFDVFSTAHPRAGEGKYIKKTAIQPDGSVRGAHHVNPYLEEEEGCYATIVEVFHRDTGIATLRQLVAERAVNHIDGVHLVWRGRRTPETEHAILVSPWRTVDELWELATRLNPRLAQYLAGHQCKRDQVLEHLPAKRKFGENLDIMRRTTKVRLISSGEEKVQGGTTPCAKPLEQANFAIDKAFLFTGHNHSGDPIGHYHYRMAYGRSIPCVQYKRDAEKMPLDSPGRYRDAKVMRMFLARGDVAKIDESAGPVVVT